MTMDYFKVFLFSLVSLSTVMAALEPDLEPSCDRPIYCDSDVLHHVQLARIYNDSKTFVDLHMLEDEETIISNFASLLNETNGELTVEQIKEFVDDHFEDFETLEAWTPPDYSSDPAFLAGIRDEQLRTFGKNVNDIWPILGKKVKQEVFDDPKSFSLVPVTHGFIIPGGRFTELYYWDTYWIIEGLLISGMKDTARGKIENLIELLKLFGLVPNGSRVYYRRRSQPPLLTAMVLLYYRETNNITFLEENIDHLEKELNFWLDNQIVSFKKDDRTYTLLRYFAPSKGPRPESYKEDYEDSLFFTTEDRKKEFYIDIKSAAESGWDFSTRWFSDSQGRNTGNLTTVATRYIIPVDLNSIFANALKNVAYFNALLGRPYRAAHWAYLATQWRSSIEQVFWHEEDGIWYDYDIQFNMHRRYFYPSNVAPLWMGAVDKKLIQQHSSKILSYLINSTALDYPGGVPTSLTNSGEQWDFPNGWPPLVSIVVNALEAIGTDDAKNLAFDVAQKWVRACYKGFNENQQMFEKYDVETPGQFGGGGEYTIQEGFGWSNGVVLEFLAKYGRTLTLVDSQDGESTRLDVIPLSADAEIPEEVSSESFASYE